MNAALAAPRPLPVARNQVIRLSHSKKSVAQTCGYRFKLQYIDKLESKFRSANLLYGNAVHAGIAATLTALALTGQMIDPIPAFQDYWDNGLRHSDYVTEFSSTWTPEGMKAAGELSLRRFMEDWRQRGWEVVIDAEGMPVIERELVVALPGDIVFKCILDALVRDAQGRIIVVDFKTPSDAAMDGFAELSDQLLGYQVACDAHAQSLAIPAVDGMVFYELIKKNVPKTSKGTGPSIHVAEPAKRRPPERIAEWISEMQFVAEDIRRKRFNRRAADSYNTPCELCDFASACRSNDISGLRRQQWRP